MFTVSNWCENEFQCIPSRTINNNELFTVNWLDRSRDFVYIDDQIRLTNKIENNSSCFGKIINICFELIFSQVWS